MKPLRRHRPFALLIALLGGCAMSGSGDEFDATLRESGVGDGRVTDARTDGAAVRSDAATTRMDAGGSSSANRDAQADVQRSIPPGSAGPGEACTDDVDCGRGANCCDRTNGVCACRYALACDTFWCGP